MRKLFGALFAASLVLGGTAVAGAAVGGERPTFDPTLTLTPASGPAGSTFTVSGSGCVDRDGGDMSVDVTAADTVEMMITTTPDDAGDWSVDLTVPDDATEGDEITVDATCIESFLPVNDQSFQSFRAPQGQSIGQPYETATFTVTASPTTTEATTTTEAPDDGDVDDATAAQPVQATPTFTG